MSTKKIKCPEICGRQANPLEQHEFKVPGMENTLAYSLTSSISMPLSFTAFLTPFIQPDLGQYVLYETVCAMLLKHFISETFNL